MSGWLLDPKDRYGPWWVGTQLAGPHGKSSAIADVRRAHRRDAAGCHRRRAGPVLIGLGDGLPSRLGVRRSARRRIPVPGLSRGEDMKAIVQDAYGPAGVLKLGDIGRPAIGDGEVLVRVRAAGVDPAVWHLMTGEPYLVRAMGFGPRKPTGGGRGVRWPEWWGRAAPACPASVPGTRYTGPARAARSLSARPHPRSTWRP